MRYSQEGEREPTLPARLGYSRGSECIFRGTMKRNASP